MDGDEAYYEINPSDQSQWSYRDFPNSPSKVAAYETVGQSLTYIEDQFIQPPRYNGKTDPALFIREYEVISAANQ